MNEYEPDCVTPPGEILQEVLEHLELTPADLAEQTGIPQDEIDGILQGVYSLSNDSALKIAKAIQCSADVLINLERQRREASANGAE